MRDRYKERFALIRGSAPFLLGFVAGILLLAIMRDAFLGKNGLLGSGSTGALAHLNIHRSRLFWYVVRLRMRTVFLVLLLSFAPFGRWVGKVAAAWYGLTFGMLLTAAYAGYGIKGLWLICVCLFPQILVYVPAFVLLYRLSDKISDRTGKYMGNGEQVLILAAAVLLLTIIGCLAEGYMNPTLVMKVLKNFKTIC